MTRSRIPMIVTAACLFLAMASIAAPAPAQLPGGRASRSAVTHVLTARVNEVFVTRDQQSVGHATRITEEFCFEVTVRHVRKGGGVKPGDVLYVRYRQVLDPAARPVELLRVPRKRSRVLLDLKRNARGRFDMIGPRAGRELTIDPTNFTEESLQRVRQLLREYLRQTRSSVLRFDDRAPDPLGVLAATGPIEEVLHLYKKRDPVVRDLGGHFGIVAAAVDPERFQRLFVKDLGNDDVAHQRFVCKALRYNWTPDARDGLKNLLRKPGTDLEASFTLARRGYVEGIPMLMAYAKSEKHWALNVLPCFRQCSDQDFGKDLEAWWRHFLKRGIIRDR
jgi:hypothetical protein